MRPPSKIQIENISLRVKVAQLEERIQELNKRPKLEQSQLNTIFVAVERICDALSHTVSFVKERR